MGEVEQRTFDANNAFGSMLLQSFLCHYGGEQLPGVVFDQTTESLRDLPSSLGPTLSKIEPLRIADPSGLLEKSFGAMAGGAGKEIRLIALSSSSLELNTLSEELSLACFAWRRRIELTPPTALIIIDEGCHEFQLSGPGQGPGLTE